MTANVAVGIFPSCTDRSMPIVELGVAAEERGFTSMFLNEHTHLPVAHPRSQFPGGGATPDTYARFWDPFIALAFVASATTRLTVGTAVSLVAQHDAIALAKAIATLDALSDGRLVIGVGWGWNREEVEDHGVAASTRASVALEHVAAMQALWTHDVAEFHGDRVRFGPSRSWPKPVQRPHPPLLLGAPASPRNFDRVVAQFDGWIPMGPNVLFEDALDGQLRELRARWDGAGRSGSPRITCIQAIRSAERLGAAVDRAGALGVERVVLYVGELGRDATLDLLDRLAPGVPVAAV